MLKDAGRRNFDVVMAWAIDRIGRSLIDLLGTIQHLEAVGVDLYLDQQSIDTTTPMGKLVFQITGAFAEFERSMIPAADQSGAGAANQEGNGCADAIAMKLGIEKTAMVRVRAGISYALTEKLGEVTGDLFLFRLGPLFADHAIDQADQCLKKSL
jgi:Resolvase, N terminal domain